eukprot:gene32734-37827_t
MVAPEPRAAIYEVRAIPVKPGFEAWPLIASRPGRLSLPRSRKAAIGLSTLLGNRWNRSPGRRFRMARADLSGARWRPRRRIHALGKPFIAIYMVHPMRPIIEVLQIILNFYWFVVMASVVLSWLINFNVINTRNDLVRMIWRVTYDLTEPVYRRIRQVVPTLGGVDFSPFILLLIIYLLQRYLGDYVWRYVP